MEADAYVAGERTMRFKNAKKRRDPLLICPSKSDEPFLKRWLGA